MNNYELTEDEVILYENSDLQEYSKIILTSKKLIFEKTETIKAGLFKTRTETKIADIIMLNNIKTYNNKPQIHQKNCDVFMQTIDKNFSLRFSGIIEAKKFVTKIIDAITGTSMFKRGAEKIKDTFNTVDDVLGFNTRDTVKGVIENGFVGTLLKGTKKNKK